MTMASTPWLTMSSMREITAATSPAVSMTLTFQPFSVGDGLEGLDIELGARLGEIGGDDRDVLGAARRAATKAVASDRARRKPGELEHDACLQDPLIRLGFQAL